jgi:hypothetical protein
MATDTFNHADKAASVSEHNETLPPVALASEAKQAAAAEHEMTLWQAIKTYPHAIGWSLLLSSTLSKFTPRATRYEANSLLTR